MEKRGGSLLISLDIMDRDQCMAADDELSAHRIVTHGGELEARQGAVAGYADVLNQSLVLAIEGVGRIDFGVYDQTLRSGVGLAA